MYQPLFTIQLVLIYRKVLPRNPILKKLKGNLSTRKMNIITRQLASLIISILVFVIISYSNTFDSLILNNSFKCICSFLWGFCLKKFFNDKWSFWFSTLVLALLTIFVLYPFDFDRRFYFLPNYSFAIIGYFFGFMFFELKNNTKIIISSIIIGFLIFNVRVIYPFYITTEMVKRGTEIENKNINVLITDAKVIDKNQNQIKNLKKGKVYLLDFYFTHCTPCKIKEKALEKINALHYENFEILKINDGKIDSFQSFLNSDSNAISSINSFYDKDGILSKKLAIDRYPFELIIDKQGIIRFVSGGFPSDFEANYISLTKGKINKLINE